MAHNIVLQAYERSLQAYGHKLPHYVSLREDPKKIQQIRKIQEKLQQLENSCKKISAGLKKISAVIHNREDEKCCKNEKAVSYAKGKSNRTSMVNSSKYIPPPMRKKGKQPTNIESKEEGKCWKCGDKYFPKHKCALYTGNIVARNSKKTQKDEEHAGADKNNLQDKNELEQLQVSMPMSPLKSFDASKEFRNWIRSTYANGKEPPIAVETQNIGKLVETVNIPEAGLIVQNEENDEYEKDIDPDGNEYYEDQGGILAL